MSRSIAVIGAPTSAGAYSPGQEDAPEALREAGLVEALIGEGFEVFDRGDIPRWRWRPDRESPRAMHAAAVAAGIRAVATEVAAAAAAGQTPLVLGGDCTVEVGTVAGMRSTLDRLRLVYLDAHPDLNVPGAVVDGAFDWMGVAHMLDLPGANPEVAAAAGMAPVLELDQLMLLANSPPRSSEHELRAIAERGISNIAEQDFAADPAGAARRAVEWASGSDGYLVHLDTDTIDFAELPLSENTDRNVSLPFETVMTGLDVLLAGEGFAALTVTEVNPHHGEPDGKTVATFVERLVRSLRGIRRRA
ncbi:MAG TPA: arginase family protein [Solirubrobacterales bacterium]|nr:arginase family protein [Solirubrobacterales bacterium]